MSTSVWAVALQTSAASARGRDLRSASDTDLSEDGGGFVLRTQNHPSDPLRKPGNGELWQWKGWAQRLSMIELSSVFAIASSRRTQRKSEMGEADYACSVRRILVVVLLDGSGCFMGALLQCQRCVCG